MFVLAVVLMFLLVAWAVMFTDLVDGGFRKAGSDFLAMLRGTHPHP